MQMYGNFEGFLINSRLLGLVSYHDPCRALSPNFIAWLRSRLDKNCQIVAGLIGEVTSNKWWGTTFDTKFLVSNSMIKLLHSRLFIVDLDRRSLASVVHFSCQIMTFRWCLASAKKRNYRGNGWSWIFLPDFGRFFWLVTYITWKVVGTTPMYSFIMAPYDSPPFGSCAIYFHHNGVMRYHIFLISPFRYLNFQRLLTQEWISDEKFIY